MSPLPSAHNVLRDIPGAPLVVMTDFAAAGRPTAQFPELVPLLTTRATFWETAPPPFGHQGRTQGGDHYGSHWLSDIVQDGRPVAAVLGFCSGSVYAGWLADRLRGRQGEPAVVLLDPEPSSRSMVMDDFVKLITSRMGNLISENEAENILAAARRADRVAGDEVLELTDVLVSLCRGVVREGSVRLGGLEHRCDEFIALFVGYLQWLAGACTVSDYRGWAGATAILSSTTEIGLQACPSQVREVLIGGIMQIPVPHFDLLRSSEVARAVEPILADSLAKAAFLAAR